MYVYKNGEKLENDISLFFLHGCPFSMCEQSRKENGMEKRFTCSLQKKLSIRKPQKLYTVKWKKIRRKKLGAKFFPVFLFFREKSFEKSISFQKKMLEKKRDLLLKNLSKKRSFLQVMCQNSRMCGRELKREKKLYRGQLAFWLIANRNESKKASEHDPKEKV